MLTDAEIDYFGSQRLGRLATVGQDGVPHVVPVTFRYNPEVDTICPRGTLGETAGPSPGGRAGHRLLVSGRRNGMPGGHRCDHRPDDLENV